MGVVHDHLAGPGELGEDGGVEPALVDSEHGDAVPLGEHHVFGHKAVQGEGLDVGLTVLAGAQTEFLDILRCFLLHQSLHNIEEMI